MKAQEEAKTSELKMDSRVTDTVETNPYTNPNGKNTVKTKSASEIENIPRELGGEERTRRGH